MAKKKKMGRPRNKIPTIRRGVRLPEDVDQALESLSKFKGTNPHAEMLIAIRGHVGL